MEYSTAELKKLLVLETPIMSPFPEQAAPYSSPTHNVNEHIAANDSGTAVLKRKQSQSTTCTTIWDLLCRASRLSPDNGLLLLEKGIQSEATRVSYSQLHQKATVSFFPRLEQVKPKLLMVF